VTVAGKLDASRGVNWRRIVAAGALWALVYNFVWGVAWFAFMRTAWEAAVAAIGRPIPWTAEVWFLWAVLTVPIGVAIMAYARSRMRAPRTAAVTAAAAVWLLLTLGTGVHALSESLSMGVIVWDSCVNLGAMVAASLTGAWTVEE